VEGRREKVTEKKRKVIGEIGKTDYAIRYMNLDRLKKGDKAEKKHVV